MFNYRRHALWIERQALALAPFLVRQEIQLTDRGTPCIRIRLETAQYLGELIVTDEGKGSFMVADLAAGALVIERHEIVLSGDESSCYSEFLRYFPAMAGVRQGHARSGRHAL